MENLPKVRSYFESSHLKIPKHDDQYCHRCFLRLQSFFLCVSSTRNRSFAIQATKKNPYGTKHGHDTTYRAFINYNSVVARIHIYTRNVRSIFLLSKSVLILSSSLSLSACQSTVCWCILYAIFSCLFAFISTAKRRSLQFYSLSKSEKYVLKIESVVFYLVVCSKMHSQSVSRAPHAASNRITLPYACVRWLCILWTRRKKSALSWKTFAVSVSMSFCMRCMPSWCS